MVCDRLLWSVTALSWSNCPELLRGQICYRCLFYLKWGHIHSSKAALSAPQVLIIWWGWKPHWCFGVGWFEGSKWVVEEILQLLTCCTCLRQQGCYCLEEKQFLKKSNSAYNQRPGLGYRERSEVPHRCFLVATCLHSREQWTDAQTASVAWLLAQAASCPCFWGPPPACRCFHASFLSLGHVSALDYSAGLNRWRNYCLWAAFSCKGIFY